MAMVPIVSQNVVQRCIEEETTNSVDVCTIYTEEDEMSRDVEWRLVYLLEFFFFFVVVFSTRLRDIK